MVACLSVILCACAARQPWMNPTGRAASVPGPPEPDFTHYVDENRIKIRAVLEGLFHDRGASPFLGGYSLEEATAMRAPFQMPEHDREICSDLSRGGGKGFLLIHGLTDSPYMMRSISESLHRAYPCAVIRAVLLPGHGTAPGDTLTMKHEDWMRVTDYGVKSFQKDGRIRELYLIGFSTGTALAIRHMKDGKNSDKIKGLILLSPAVKAKSPLIWAAGAMGVFKEWERVYAEKDAARYESFSFNAAAEFYRLTHELTSTGFTLNAPVLMAVSADDDTIDANAARSFFCSSASSPRRALIWYRSAFTNDGATTPCGDIATVDLKNPDQRYNGVPYRVANISHIAVPVSPGDRHYGVSGAYRNCKSYENGGTPDDAANCRKGSETTIFGENNINSAQARRVLGYDYWRRGTFNPDYERLEKSIICFVNEACQLGTVLDFSRRSAR